MRSKVLWINKIARSPTVPLVFGSAFVIDRGGRMRRTATRYPSLARCAVSIDRNTQVPPEHWQCGRKSLGEHPGTLPWTWTKHFNESTSMKRFCKIASKRVDVFGMCEQFH